MEFFLSLPFQYICNIRPHYNVLLLLGACTIAPPYCLVTEYMDGGSLYTLLTSDRKIANDDLVRIVKGVGRGLLHLHMEGVVHRDLAARNILLKETKDGFEPKISVCCLVLLQDTLSANLLFIRLLEMYLSIYPSLNITTYRN